MFVLLVVETLELFDLTGHVFPLTGSSFEIFVAVLSVSGNCIAVAEMDLDSA